MHKTILIFDDEFNGHHPDYLKYLYDSSSDYLDVYFIFIVHKNLEYIFTKYINNTKVIYLSDFESKKLLHKKYFKSFYLTILLNKYIKIYRPSEIFLISLISILPFGIFLKSNNKISGIIYQIYLYRWASTDLKTRIFDIIKYRLLTLFSVFNNIFILNDTFSAKYLCKIYKSNKFCYVPDPLIKIESNKLVNLGLDDRRFQNRTVCLHLGYLESRKGTLEIIQSIANLNNEDSKKYLFIFGGKISDEIKISFYSIYNSISHKSNIIIHDYYLSNEFLQSLIFSSDLILIPYKNVYQSSGVLGLSCQFSKPVVVSKRGLLGKLVKKYKLGYIIEETSVLCITEFLKKYETKLFNPNSTYLINKLPTDFSGQILNKLIHG